VRGRGPVGFVRVALGPQLGQCCGGQISLMIETFDRRDLAQVSELAGIARTGALQTRSSPDPDGRLRRQIAAFARPLNDVVQLKDGTILENFTDRVSSLLLFGAGHVGKALILALAPLPFRLRWIDPRPSIFPDLVPQNAIKVHASDVLAEVEAAASGAFVLVMTHSHALDFDIVAKALSLERFNYVGLIGSLSKRARFIKRMTALGLNEKQISGLTCPIGVPGISGKEPATIAAATAAQLLMVRGAGPFAVRSTVPER
jgi:xanthine dehydrogenase accessory factor